MLYRSSTIRSDKEKKKLNFAFKKSFPNLLKKSLHQVFDIFCISFGTFHLSQSVKIIQPPLLVQHPPLLVQRCDATTSVLLPGWVILMHWNCPCKFFSLGSWLMSALSTPNGGEGHNSAIDLNSVKNSSILLQCIQAASPSSRQNPQAKCCM